MRIPRRRAPWAIAVVLLLLALARLLQHTAQPTAPDVLPEGEYRVQHVTDGDTLKLENGARIRLVGINTPELARDGQPAEPFAQQATEFTRRFIGNRPVTLRFDLERQDRYGRFLAYVHVDGTSLGEALLSAGLAQAGRNYHYSDSMKRKYRKLEDDARAAKRGMWAEK